MKYGLVLILLGATCTSVIGTELNGGIVAQLKEIALSKQYAGDFDGAAGFYTWAIHLDPASNDAYFGRAYSRYKLNDFAGCSEDNSKVIERYPHDISALNNRGYALSRLGEHARALQDFDHIIKHDPCGIGGYAFNNRGWLRAQMGDLEGGLTDCNESIRINSVNAEAYANRGYIKSLLGDETAQADFEKAHELDPMQDWKAKVRVGAK